MTDDLFPTVARSGRAWDLDADAWDHRQRTVAKPSELTVTEDAEIGKLYGPDGRRYRTVREDRPRVPFGFTHTEEPSSE